MWWVHEIGVLFAKTKEMPQPLTHYTEFFFLIKIKKRKIIHRCGIQIFNNILRIYRHQIAELESKCKIQVQVYELTRQVMCQGVHIL